MASNSPETEGRKRKDSIGSLKRDQPLFTARRLGPPSQQPTEFFTDSLNNSYIPSPSPPKENARPGILPKPRQKLGTPRSLAASFKAASDQSHWPSSPTSPERKLSPHKSSIRPPQSNVRNTAKLPSRPTYLPRRLTTPEPTRGRKFTVVSPSSSASSPPRGLAEAYQRIKNEENLAEEDGNEAIEDDMGSHANGNSDQERQEVDRIRSQRLQDAPSPTSLKASRMSSPWRLDEENLRPKNQGNEIGNSSHLSGSETGTSYMDNLTGTSSLGELSSYAKDMERVNRAIKSGPLFAKRSRLGNGTNLVRLKPPERSDESSDSTHGSESVSSMGSTLYANVPPQWGRKSRPAKDWLNRINTKSGGLSGDMLKNNSVDNLVLEKAGHDEAIDGWIMTGAQDSKTGEDQASQQERLPPNHDPFTAGRKQSLERVEEWELNEDDFTGRSLQVSDSPPIRVRNAALDPILEREIDSLAKRAVTTSRLGEIRVKTSEENLVRKLHIQSAEDLSLGSIESDRESLRRKRSSLKFPLKPFVENRSYSSISGAVLGSGGDPIPSSPITIYRSNSNVSSNENGAGGTKTEEEKVSYHRPSHGRADSRDLLRELARATSQTSTPTTSTSTRTSTPIKEGDEVDAQTQTTGKDKGVAFVVEPQLEIEPTAAVQQAQVKDKTKNIDILPSIENIGIEKSIQQMARHSKSFEDLRAPQEKPLEQTPRQLRSTADLKTPIVTGAWIDTPLPTSSHRPLSSRPNDLEEKNLNIEIVDPSEKKDTTHLIRKLNPNVLSPRPKSQTQRPLSDSNPLLPKSALESIINAAKSKSRSTSLGVRKSAKKSHSDSDEDPTLQLSEETIQSLEKMLAHDDGDTTPSENSPEEATIQPLPSPPISPREDHPVAQQQLPSHPQTPPKGDPTLSRPATRAQNSRYSELQSYGQQIARLGNVGPSIRDAKKRLTNLEKVISSAVPSPSQPKIPQGECDEAGEFHDFIWPCERCGCTARRDSETVASNIPQQGGVAIIQIPVPRLWRWHRNSWRPRVTWLGVFALIGVLWWVADEIAWYIRSTFSASPISNPVLTSIIPARSTVILSTPTPWKATALTSPRLDLRLFSSKSSIAISATLFSTPSFDQSMSWFLSSFVLLRPWLDILLASCLVGM